MTIDPFFGEISDDDFICPHCEYEANIGALIGETTDNCPKCGEVVLYAINFDALEV